MSCLCLYIGFFKVDADERCFSSSFSLSSSLSRLVLSSHPTSHHPPTTYHLPFSLETLSPPLFVSGSCTYSAIEVNITIITRICARTCTGKEICTLQNAGIHPKVLSKRAGLPRNPANMGSEDKTPTWWRSFLSMYIFLTADERLRLLFPFHLCH